MNKEATYNSAPPPLGVTPRFIHERNRIVDIIMAMERMVQAGCEINPDWLDEIQDLLPRYNTHIKLPKSVLCQEKK